MENISPDSIRAQDCSEYNYLGRDGCISLSFPSSSLCCGNNVCSASNTSCNGTQCVASGSVRATSCSFCVDSRMRDSVPSDCYLNVSQCWMTCQAPRPDDPPDTPPDTPPEQPPRDPDRTLPDTSPELEPIENTPPPTDDRPSSEVAIAAPLLVLVLWSVSFFLSPPPPKVRF